MSAFKPMLAEEAVLGSIKYPKVGSFKHNGVRGLVKEGTLFARSLKKIPNKYTQKLFGNPLHDGLDSELVVGPFDAEDVFGASTSGVMSVAGQPDVRMYVFDTFAKHEQSYLHRLGFGMAMVEKLGHPRIEMIPYRELMNDTQMLEFHRIAEERGFEGIVLRDPNAEYKFGRSTQKEGGFLRYVMWYYSEAEVLSVEEKMHNANPKMQSELGYAKRSSHKENMIPTGTAGAMQVRDLKTGVVFSLPVGGTALCAQIWRDRLKVPGRIAKYKFKKTTKVKPRHPQFEGFRDKRDM